MPDLSSFDIDNFIEKYRLPIALILSICAVISGVVFFLESRKENEEIRFLTQEELAQVKGINETDVELEKILIDIAGQVKNPGVIEMPSGSSILDVIGLAGGFTDKADMTYIHQEMNLAKLVEDRDKIYIPSVEERVAASQIEAGSSSNSEESSSLININTASAGELDTLPGIGPSTAEKIIDARPYSQVEDLLEVSGIGESTLEKIRNKITI